MLQTDDPEHRYTLLELIGRGSFGRVYKAMDKETGGIVAIKLIPICEEGNEDELKKIIREINLLQQCDSSYVTAYYGSYFKDKRLWIVMEYCSGGSLKRVMTRLKSPLTEEEISVVCYQVAKGLAHLHSRRLLHRDIKADNILLHSNGLAKLADLGVATMMINSMDKHKTATGSPFWMAPELVCEQEYTTRVDIWSLGITCIELAEIMPPYANMQTMRALFLIASPETPPPKLTHPEKWSTEFQDFIARCLVRDYNQRASAGELLEHPFLTKAAGLSGLLTELVERVNACVTEEKKTRIVATNDKKKSKFAKVLEKVKGPAHDSSYGSKEEEIVIAIGRAKEIEQVQADGTESLTSLEEVRTKDMSIESIKTSRKADGAEIRDQLQGEESVGTIESETWRTREDAYGMIDEEST